MTQKKFWNSCSFILWIRKTESREGKLHNVVFAFLNFPAPSALNKCKLSKDKDMLAVARVYLNNNKRKTIIPSENPLVSVINILYPQLINENPSSCLSLSVINIVHFKFNRLCYVSHQFYRSVLKRLCYVSHQI